MFLRRRKLALPERLRDFVWPRSGWRRFTRYAFHRMARLPGSPQSIAAGFAFGAAISFTPFVGLHFVLAAIMAWLARVNVVASAVGTAVGNPWTFPFIWIWVYELGIWMGGGNESAAAASLDFAGIFGAVLDALLSLNFAYLVEVAGPVLWPMLVGSIPTFVVVWLAFYFSIKPMVADYQARRVRRRHRRRRTRKQETQ